MSDPTEEFVQNIAEHQNPMFGYIYSLLGDHSRASDVLQESNLVLWRKKDDFHTGAPFLPWAFGIARMQVMAHLRDRGRDRCLLDPDLVGLISDESEKQATEIDSVRMALRQCIGELTPEHREMIQARYFDSVSIDVLATSLDRGVSATKVMLMRVRRKLGECVQRRMAAEA